MERSTKVLDAAGLKALAHPLRVRLIGLLREDGPATATGLAERTGETSGTTSYHLRQLAAAGFVSDAVGRGNARERWWQAAQDSTRIEAEDFVAFAKDPGVRPALDAYLDAVLSSYAARAEAFRAEQHTWPRRWAAASTFSDFVLPLSAAELTRLNDEVEQLVESYRRPRRRGDEDVVVQVQAFPRRRRPGGPP